MASFVMLPVPDAAGPPEPAAGQFSWR